MGARGVPAGEAGSARTSLADGSFDGERPVNPVGLVGAPIDTATGSCYTVILKAAIVETPEE